jgi:hypothetical protein
MITPSRSFFSLGKSRVRTRALDLKRQGIDAADAGKRLTAAFKAKYADWPINDLTNFVKSIYAE